MARLAAASVFPTTRGTVQCAGGGGGGGGEIRTNSAVAVRLPSIVTVHEPLPEQAPDHPAKVELESACAVNVTKVPCAKAWVHVEPQSIPAGMLAIEPPPVPVFATLSVFSLSKIATADRSPVIVSVQVPAPEQPPIQAVKVDPAAGTAVSVTSVP